MLQEEGNRTTFTGTVLGQTTTCTVSFHVANGQVQYDRRSGSC